MKDKYYIVIPLIILMLASIYLFMEIKDMKKVVKQTQDITVIRLDAMAEAIERRPKVYKFHVEGIGDVPDVLAENLVFKDITISGVDTGIMIESTELLPKWE